jgi:nicotinamidase-related amidase
MAVSLENYLQPGKVAVVLCEVQERTIGESAPWQELLPSAARKVNLVANAARINDAARAHKAPVFHSTAGYQENFFGMNRNGRLYGAARKTMSGPDPKLDAPFPAVYKKGDIILPRYTGLSPMWDSGLDSMLRNEGITTLILVGVSVNFAILNLCMDASNRAYQVIIPKDAVAGFPDEYVAMVMQHTLPMISTIVTTDDIVNGWK